MADTTKFDNGSYCYYCLHKFGAVVEGDFDGLALLNQMDDYPVKLLAEREHFIPENTKIRCPEGEVRACCVCNAIKRGYRFATSDEAREHIMRKWRERGIEQTSRHAHYYDITHALPPNLEWDKLVPKKKVKLTKYLLFCHCGEVRCTDMSHQNSESSWALTREVVNA